VISRVALPELVAERRGTRLISPHTYAFATSLLDLRPYGLPCTAPVATWLLLLRGSVFLDISVRATRRHAEARTHWRAIASHDVLWYDAPRSK
jgi:hypothetical protein